MFLHLWIVELLQISFIKFTEYPKIRERTIGHLKQEESYGNLIIYLKLCFNQPVWMFHDYMKCCQSIQNRLISVYCSKQMVKFVAFPMETNTNQFAQISNSFHQIYHSIVRQVHIKKILLQSLHTVQRSEPVAIKNYPDRMTKI